STSPTNTGTALAQDGCGSVTVTYSDNISTNCGNTKGIIRTWTATDACGNSTNATQRIVIRDLTPPTLTVPADIALECPANTATNNTGVASAQDGCGSVTLSYSDTLSTNCGNTKVIARRWTATDSCGNSTNAVQ